MNYSTAVMLFNDNIRAIQVSYELGPDGKPSKLYTFKTLDTSIVVGDYVTVPTTLINRHNMTVCRVEEVDVEVDFDSDIELQWAIAKVDTSAYSAVLSEEKRWVQAIRESEKRKKKEDIKNNMQAMLQENGVAVVSLPVFAKETA